MKHHLVAFVILTAGLPGILAQAAPAPLPHPFIAPVFCDNMVLQRDQADPIWGWAKPAETLTVTIGGQTATAIANQDGTWVVRITPPRAGGPYELKISASQTVTFHNVLVGDVWICSGQSNMEFGIKRLDQAAQEIAQADHPEMRLFVVGKTTALHPVETLQGQWVPCTPATVQVGPWDGFSAVGYFFGRELHQHLKVPIGLIQAAWGATPAEAWTSREGLAKIGPDFDAALAGLSYVDQAVQAGTCNRQELLDQWYAKSGVSADVSTPGFDVSGWKTMHRLPHLWGINDDPALGDFQGAVWFRKEIDLPAEAAGKEARISLGVLDDGDVTWINGVKVGGEMNLSPRKYKVRAGVLQPGRNVIAIWLLNSFGPGGMAGQPEDYRLNVAGVPPLLLAGDWQYKVLAPLDQMPVPLYSINHNAGWSTEIFNAMIAPLAPYGIKGVVWYQGEANVGRAYQYRKLLPALISSWRERWQQGDFPFLVVQLPNFGRSPGARPADCADAELREAQALAAQALPNVGVINTLDIGDPGDLHPRNKLDVGRRLGLLARAGVYHEDIAFSGPVYKSCHQDGSALRITFDYATGLHAKNGAPLKNFAVAGVDRIFHWAEARLDGRQVVLTASGVPQPVAARYAWDPSPNGNLYNHADLPAFPFRTDDWPAVTLNKR